MDRKGFALVPILVIALGVMIAGGVFYYTHRSATVPWTMMPSQPIEPLPSIEFPQITFDTPGRIEKLDSLINLSVRESFKKEDNGPKLHFVLTTDKIYPNGCYRLAAGFKIENANIFVDIKGISVYEGPCTQALQAPSFTVDLPVTPKNYSLFIKSANSIDQYAVSLGESKIGIAPGSRAGFTKLSDKELLLIPPDSMWINVGYAPNRDIFATQKKTLVDGLKALGAQEFSPARGKYAYGVWGLATLTNGRTPDGQGYGSGHYADDFLYFKFIGDISNVRNLVRQFTKYECVSGSQSCMSISLRTWQGEEIDTWLLK